MTNSSPRTMIGTRPLGNSASGFSLPRFLLIRYVAERGFAENSENELEEAIAELETDSFMQMSRTMGTGQFNIYRSRGSEPARVHFRLCRGNG